MICVLQIDHQKGFPELFLNVHFGTLASRIGRRGAARPRPPRWPSGTRQPLAGEYMTARSRGGTTLRALAVAPTESGEDLQQDAHDNPNFAERSAFKTAWRTHVNSQARVGGGSPRLGVAPCGDHLKINKYHRPNALHMAPGGVFLLHMHLCNRNYFSQLLHLTNSPYMTPMAL